MRSGATAELTPVVDVPDLIVTFLCRRTRPNRESKRVKREHQASEDCRIGCHMSAGRVGWPRHGRVRWLPRSSVRPRVFAAIPSTPSRTRERRSGDGPVRESYPEGSNSWVPCVGVSLDTARYDEAETLPIAVYMREVALMCPERQVSTKDTMRAITTPGSTLHRASALPESVHTALHGTGAALPTHDRAAMEAHFGYNFANVRIYDDAAAARSADDVRANAYSFGNKIVFANSVYRPGDSHSRRVLAHELTHVIQQPHAESRPRGIAKADATAEREANANAINFGQSRSPRSSLGTTSSGLIHCQPKGARNDLAEEIRRVWRQRGGITVAFYGGKVHGPGAGPEFQRQATQFAQDHRAIGMPGGKAEAGVAIEITKSIPALLEDLEVAISGILRESTRVPVRTLAIFTHGIETELEAGPIGGTSAQVQWISDVKGWVNQLAPYLSLAPSILLYACRTGGQPAKGMPFAAGVAQYLQEAIAARHPGNLSRVAPEVWGHRGAAHTTANPQVVKYGGTGAASNQEDFESRLATAMVAAAIERAGRHRADRSAVSGPPPITDDQQAALTKDAATAIRGIFRTIPAETGTKSPKNDYIREIPTMGIRRAVSDLVTEATPNFADLGLTSEAAMRVSEGFVIFKKLLDSELAKLQSVASRSRISDR